MGHNPWGMGCATRSKAKALKSGFGWPAGVWGGRPPQHTGSKRRESTNPFGVFLLSRVVAGLASPLRELLWYNEYH